MASYSPATVVSGFIVVTLSVACNPVQGHTPPREAGVSQNCGNGLLDPGEECDDGNLVPFDDCHSDCQLPGTEIWSVGEETPYAQSIVTDDQGNVYVALADEYRWLVRRYDSDGTEAWTSETEPPPNPQPSIPDLYGGWITWSPSIDSAVLGWWRDSWDPPFDPQTSWVATMSSAGVVGWVTEHIGMSVFGIAAGAQGRVAITGEHDTDDPQWPEPSLKILDPETGADLVDLQREQFAQGDAGRSLAYGSDGTLFAALGYNDDTAYLLRIQPDGTVDLEGQVNCPGWYFLRALPNGNLVLGGIRSNETTAHICVVDSDLHLVRSATYETPALSASALRAMAVGANGHVALAGMALDSTSGPPGYTFLAHLDANLELRWEWTRETGDTSTEQGWSVAIAPNGDILVLRLIEDSNRWEITRFRP